MSSLGMSACALVALGFVLGLGLLDGALLGCGGCWMRAWRLAAVGGVHEFVVACHFAGIFTPGAMSTSSSMVEKTPEELREEEHLKQLEADIWTFSHSVSGIEQTMSSP